MSIATDVEALVLQFVAEEYKDFRGEITRETNFLSLPGDPLQRKIRIADRIEDLFCITMSQATLDRYIKTVSNLVNYVLIRQGCKFSEGGENDSVVRGRTG